MSQTTIEEQRDSLQEVLMTIDGVKKVYFQPPRTNDLEYPCIIYTLENYISHHSNNRRYLTFLVYSLTLIDYDVESPIQKSIMDLYGDFHISFDRYYTFDNLNHWVYKLKYTKALW